jgi:exopolyphosphatase/guanosine-5'-triphosphate,3'-diphosphate pyrophosphatase
MGQQAVNVGVVDIGTNSMRLLITNRVGEVGRWVEVTGLGRGVDRTGALSPEAIQDSLVALARFGSRMDSEGVESRIAIATSASRDASNREMFFDLAESALGVRPILITGEREARLAYAGAARTTGLEPPLVVSDIGGGSTEFVTAEAALSVDVGSVRLTERAIPSRPPRAAELATARAMVDKLFAEVDLVVGTLVGVAGTWTSLAAIAQELPRYSRDLVEGYRLTKVGLEGVIEMLVGKTLEETAAIPSLDPKRAPVILAGSLVACGVVDALGVDEVLVSEHDTLDGAAMELLALP